jgi:hypothetical protein
MAGEYGLDREETSKLPRGKSDWTWRKFVILYLQYTYKYVQFSTRNMTINHFTGHAYHHETQNLLCNVSIYVN